MASTEFKYNRKIAGLVSNLIDSDRHKSVGAKSKRETRLEIKRILSHHKAISGKYPPFAYPVKQT